MTGLEETEATTIAREKSRHDDFSTAVARLQAEATAGGKTDFGTVAVRAEDLRTVLAFEAANEAMDDSLVARIEGAIGAATARGGSHAAIEVATLDAVLRKVGRLATKAAA